MGSTFVEYSGKEIGGGLFNDSKPLPVYLQFVPGLVNDVVTSQDHKDFGGSERNINSIFAIPHISNEIGHTEVKRTRYFPLFRGMTDIPVRGEQVLLCTIAGKNYYLGPLNTNNSPNFNKDTGFKRTSMMRDLFGSTEIPISKNFDYRNIVRLQKPNSILDNKHIGYTDNQEKIVQRPLEWNENYGDVVFEGRHGNSIRLGSRTDRPHIYISNGRHGTNPVESLGDGSTISMTSFGPLIWHFPYYRSKVSKHEQHGFYFASDIVNSNERSIENNKRKIKSRQLNVTRGVINPDGSPWENANVLINSENIYINSSKNDLYLSSHKDTHIGAGENLTITTHKDLLIESKKTYLGIDAFFIEKETDSKKRNDNPPQPMVLGQQLVDLLSDLIDTLANASYINAVGTPQLVHGSLPSIPGNLNKSTGGGLFKPSGYIPSQGTCSEPGSNSEQECRDAGGIWKVIPAPNPFKSLEEIQNSLEKIKSYYHFIEPNGKAQKDELIEPT